MRYESIMIMVNSLLMMMKWNVNFEIDCNEWWWSVNDDGDGKYIEYIYDNEYILVMSDSLESDVACQCGWGV